MKKEHLVFCIVLALILAGVADKLRSCHEKGTVEQIQNGTDSVHGQVGSDTFN